MNGLITPFGSDAQTLSERRFLLVKIYSFIRSVFVYLLITTTRRCQFRFYHYHIGNGVFGGLVPIIGLILIQNTGNNFAGLWYPMGIAAICFVIGAIFLRETNKADMDADVART